MLGKCRVSVGAKIMPVNSDGHRKHLYCGTRTTLYCLQVRCTAWFSPVSLLMENGNLMGIYWDLNVDDVVEV